MVIELREEAGSVSHAAEKYDSVHGSMPAIHAMRDDRSRYSYNNIAHDGRTSKQWRTTLPTPVNYCPVMIT